jgi:WhiB family redox-sensing transcriptional regulator
MDNAFIPVTATGLTPVHELLPHPKIPLGSWVSRARCATAGIDPEIFFPPRGPRKDSTAKAICATCPVRRECRQYALKASEEHGVWGGLNAAEREDLKRRRSRAEKRGAA